MITQFIVPALLFGIAGAFEGIVDRLIFHNGYTSSFWGQDSWRNKYKNKDPKYGLTFKGKYLTFLTDGFHLMKFGNHLFTVCAIASNTEGFTNEKLWIVLAQIAAYWIVNRIGFNVTYR